MHRLRFAMFLLFLGCWALAQIPDKFENLKVLPKDISKKEMIEVMKSFTQSLGVRCNFCHVGEPGKPLSSYDFASDEPEHKEIARHMMKMVSDLNQNYFNPEKQAQAPQRVNCQTCHHGLAEPKTLTQVLNRTFEKKGIDETVATYKKLKDRYYGRDSFDFSERSLLIFAEDLTTQQKWDEAITILKLNAEVYPEGTMTYTFLGECFAQKGDTAAAKQAYEKAVSLDPENREAKEALEKLK
ncbi:MAG: c-type cytochrome [Acidobacteria bacterium]|nr:c-type cytochrome [Acidobacteriota bacterium]